MAPEVHQSATEQLLSLGLPGLAILGLLAALGFLWRQIAAERVKSDARSEAHRTALEALNLQRLADRDLRLSDQKENAKVMLELSDQCKEALLSNREALKDLQDEVKSLKPPRGFR